MALSSVTLGDLTLTDQRWGLVDIQGWGSPGGTLKPLPRPRQHGAWAGWSYLEPRVLVLSGDYVGASDDDARDAADLLSSAASLDDATLTVVEGSLSRYVTVRRDDDVMVKWQPGSQRLFQWSVQVIAVDPRKRGTDLVQSTALPSSTGGLTFPHTFPHTFSTTAVTGQVSLTNPGNIAGPVTLRIDGPVTGPIVTHVSTGRSLVFASSVTLGAGEFLTVDMERREVLAQGQSSRNGWVTSRGWSQFEPGVNTWAFTAASYNAGSLLTVTATPAWM